MLILSGRYLVYVSETGGRIKAQITYRDANINDNVRADQTIPNIRILVGALRISMRLLRIPDSSVDQERLTKVESNQTHSRRNNGEDGPFEPP